MAVTILERPQGQVLSTTGIAARVDDAYGSPDATIYSVGHGLADAQYVYIESNIDDYNGFVYVDSTGTDTFKIKRYANGDYIQFIQDTDITYYVSDLSHGWSAVHLPITYRLSSNLYPLNSSDTTRTITSVTDANGYSVIHLSGSLGSAVNSYDFVKITAPNDTELSRVYQILEFISPTVMIINLEYDSGNNFASATALKEYNNYNIVVRVYAGIHSGHEWAAQKPMELAATLELIPDENNEVFFSINEYLKSYIETQNNLLLGTLPNNIDFWNSFYIETAEQYDDSDGYSFGTYISPYTSDESNFVGYSVNADLEFKNQYSGYMSEYLMNNTTAKFLTLFAIPVIFGCTDEAPDCYNEITFIKPDDSDYVLQKQFYNEGVPGLVVLETISGDEGVYRVPIGLDIPEGAEILTNTSFVTSLSPWTNEAGAGVDWGWNASNLALASVSVGTSSDSLEQTFSSQPAGNYHLLINTSSGGISTSVTFTISVYNASVLVAQVFQYLENSSSQTTHEIDFNVSTAFDQIKIVAAHVSGGLAIARVYDVELNHNAADICDFDRVDVSLLDTGLQFSNTNFTDNISPWQSFSGSDRASGTQNGTFAYSSGRAVSGISNYRTKYFAIQRGDDPSAGWPIGTYTVEITIIGFSENGPFTAAVYGMPNSSSQTLIASSVSGSISVDGTTESTITLTFTTASAYSYLAFVFDSLLDVGDVYVSLGSIEITSSPEVEIPISETKEYHIDCGCSAQEIRLTWLNNLGGFDYWSFKAEKDLLVEIRETGETKNNILPNWPKSYGSTADTRRRQTFRISNKGYTIRSQYITREEADALAYIKSSVLVQIITSRSDRRTVIVDSDSFVVYPEGSDLYSTVFNISFTNDIPSQKV